MRMKRSKEAVASRLYKGLEMERQGYSKKDIARALGYKTTEGWRALKRNMLNPSPSIIERRGLVDKPEYVCEPPQQIAFPEGVSAPRAETKLAQALGIAESDLSALIELFVSCKAAKGEEL